MDNENVPGTQASANPSGAPEAGGATTRHSRFGGDSMTARFLRFLARVARSLEATAYRRLKEMELARTGGKPSNEPGAPRRTREAAHLSDDAQLRPF